MRSADTITTESSRRVAGRNGLLQPTWTLDEAADLYQIDAWGKGFFAINDHGNVVVRPNRDPGREIDLFEVVLGLRERGLKAPVLIGFGDLLGQRIQDLNDAFAAAIRENDYQGGYCAVYPVKVNQQHHLVQDLYSFGSAYGFGLEVGSKPELLAVLGMTSGGGDERPIICNGFKEDRYIEYVMLGTRLGRNIIPVIENINELRLIVDHAERGGVRPRIGVRVNLSGPGAGRWRHSSGLKAKFGLTISEVLEVCRLLDERGMSDCLQLLHCHIGSQISDILKVNASVNELARIYVELSKMGAGLKYLDVGGGLGIDYDGSQANFEFSTNYTWEEYASNVVYRVMHVCDDAEVAHPTIISESGRAMVAHHSLLVFNVLDANRLDDLTVSEELIAELTRLEESGEEREDDLPRPVYDLVAAYNNVSERRLLECYHDAMQARQEALSMFNVGYMSLEHRGLVEQLFWAICMKVRDKCREVENVPEELEGIEDSLSDTYFGNLSVFQSLPDSWAINQIFPVMPIHRLGEYPSRRATLADITCDSDGRIDRFVDRRDIKRSLELHPLRDEEPYYLAAFLIGAYQETLGDLHNLFGDTHVVHLRFDENGRWWIEQVVEGDTVREVLSYVQYDANWLRQRIRQECERAVASGRMSVAESRNIVHTYETGLAGYTYLE